MNLAGIDPWLFAAGLGFFLYGMQQLEAGLKLVGGESLERALRRSTGHPLSSIALGIAATAVLQSSSLVGLMVLAFVGAGVLQMRNAVGVILGSNLGTTFTGWLVTAIGFKLNLGEFALPIIATGMFGVVFLERRPRAWGLSLFVLGLGLLLYGLGFMKDSVEAFSQSLDLSALAGAHPYWFFVTGFVFAAIIQSSSATMVITLSALSAGIISLHAAAAIVIGADLGTTSTLLIGSIRGNAATKQVALAHFLFNVVTDLVALFLILPWIDAGLAFAGIRDPLFGLVAFHSFFNVVGISLFLPFVDAFADFLERRFVRVSVGRSRYLGRTPPGAGAASTAALAAETRAVLGGVVDLNRRAFKLDVSIPDHGNQTWFGKGHPSYEETYATLKQVEGEILDYARQATAASTSERAAARVQHLLTAVRESIYAAKSIKDIRANLVEFRHLELASARIYLERLTQHMRHFYGEASRIYDAPATVAAPALEDLQAQDAAFTRAIVDDFYREENAAALTDLQSSTFLNVLREVDSANRALVRALQAFAAEARF